MILSPDAEQHDFKLGLVDLLAQSIYDYITWGTEKQGSIALPSQVVADSGQGNYLPDAW